MTSIIKPRLTMASRMPAHSLDTDLYNTQTVATLHIPVIMPMFSIRLRIALIMLLTSLWLIVLLVTVVFCLLSIPSIYRFVAIVTALLVGCLLSNLFVLFRYRQHLAEEPRLITQKLRGGETLLELEKKVNMDTNNYLEAVKVNE